MKEIWAQADAITSFGLPFWLLESLGFDLEFDTIIRSVCGGEGGGVHSIEGQEGVKIVQVAGREQQGDLQIFQQKLHNVQARK
jgi:hypothetical protein